MTERINLLRCSGLLVDPTTGGTFCNAGAATEDPGETRYDDEGHVILPKCAVISLSNNEKIASIYLEKCQNASIVAATTR